MNRILNSAKTIILGVALASSMAIALGNGPSVHAASRAQVHPAGTCSPSPAGCIPYAYVGDWQPDPCICPDPLRNVVAVEGWNFTPGGRVVINVVNVANGALVAQGLTTAGGIGGVAALAAATNVKGPGTFIYNLIVRACRLTTLRLFAIDTRTGLRSRPIALTPCPS